MSRWKIKHAWLVLIPVFWLSCSASQDNSVLIYSIWDDVGPKNALLELGRKFEASHPDIKIQIKSFSDADFKKNLDGWLASPTPPDLLTWVAGERLRNLAKSLAPLDNLFQDNSFDALFPRVFYESSSMNGKIYFLPQSWYWWAFYYRTSTFDKFSIKRNPRDWDEFLEICDQLKAAGLTPISLGTQNDPWTIGGWMDYLDIRVNGGNFHRDLVQGRISYTNPQVKQAQSSLFDLLGRGLINADFQNIGWKESAQRVFDEKAGMVFLGQFINDLGSPEMKQDLDFFSFPSMVKGVRPYGDAAWEDTPIDGYVKTLRAPHPKSADAFLAYLASREAQEYWANTLGRIPANKTVPAPGLSVRKGQRIAQSATGVFQFFDRDTPSEFGFPAMRRVIQGLSNTDSFRSLYQDLEKMRTQAYGPLNASDDR